MSQGAEYASTLRRPSARPTPRRRRLLTRTLPLAGVAVLAFAAGIVTATGPGRAERRLVTNYVGAWARSDFHMAGLICSTKLTWPDRSSWAAVVSWGTTRNTSFL